MPSALTAVFHGHPLPVAWAPKVDFVQLKLRQFSLPAWRDMVVQEFFVHRAEKTTYQKFETA